MKEDRKKEEKKKRKTPHNCKSPTQRQTFIAIIKSMTEYTHIHIHPLAKSKHSNRKKKVQQINPATKRNQKLYLPEQNQIKQKLENKTKARCQLGNKAMKIKLTNMLRGKERKKRKNRWKVKQRQIKKIYIH